MIRQYPVIRRMLRAGSEMSGPLPARWIAAGGYGRGIMRRYVSSRGTLRPALALLPLAKH